MKKKIDRSTWILLLVFLIGLSLLLYPTVSNYWNQTHATQAIADYSAAVADLDTAQRDRLWNEAQAYNQALDRSDGRFHPTADQQAAYAATLDVTGTGIMGSIEIPSIQVSLPIYHGVEDSVLQIAAGHIEGSSLPVGGPGTHCVLSGHRGLPSAKLFTHLDDLTEGDYFQMKVLDQTLTYEVDQILIVEPEDTAALAIQEGEDLCTLVTCTPYGINSHRLLVRGHRVENQEEAVTVRVTADAIQIEPIVIAPLLAAPMLLILLIVLLLWPRWKPNKEGMKCEDTSLHGSP